MLEVECVRSQVDIRLGAKIRAISKNEIFHLDLGKETILAKALVISTGGLSIPKIGASGFGYDIARQFGLEVVPMAPALDGFVFDPSQSAEALALKELSGVSVDCVVSCNGQIFQENILFTHRGLSGPAALQASLYWRKGDKIHINLVPEQNLLDYFRQKRAQKNLAKLPTLLGNFLPSRLVEFFCLQCPELQAPLAQISDKVLEALVMQLENWVLKPTHTVGYDKAEVTRGGVSTAELSSKTMEAKKVPGLYFIGEVVDVTGWLGGYNFQWAWASAWAAAQNL